ncbi:hypothetical protein GXB85_05380 [Cellulomonas sp. APG4]|nr:hypothetical protein [Cellulomonas sp. APG4]
MLLVDRKMRAVLGVTHRDIADACWRDFYQDGMEPTEAIIEALQGDDLYAGLIPVLQQMP